MTEVEELRLGAQRMRERPSDNEVDLAVADMLDYAAERLESHPKATGAMTQHALKIARLIS